MKLYQEKAGGVDRTDQKTAKYEVKMRGMTLPLHLTGYVVYAALNNAWQRHRMCSQDGQVDLLAFTQVRGPRVSGEQCGHIRTGEAELAGGN